MDIHGGAILVGGARRPIRMSMSCSYPSMRIAFSPCQGPGDRLLDARASHLVKPLSRPQARSQAGLGLTDQRTRTLLVGRFGNGGVGRSPLAQPHG